jgi:ABC-type Fe3+-siderophore transport system permease subunit
MSWRDDPNSFFNKYKVLIFLVILIVIIIILIIVFSEKVEHIGFGGDFAPRLGGNWD